MPTPLQQLRLDTCRPGPPETATDVPRASFNPWRGPTEYPNGRMTAHSLFKASHSLGTEPNGFASQAAFLHYALDLMG